MKKIIKLFCLIAVVMPFLNYAVAQTEHVVVLRVNTAEIKKPNIEPYCSFDGQPNNVSDADFTILVKNGDIIRWVGQSTSSQNDAVQITSINYRGGKNVLGTNVLRGEGGVVRGTVQNAQAGDEEKYTISFTVFNNGTKRNGTFLIDPKIKVH